MPEKSLIYKLNLQSRWTIRYKLKLLWFCWKALGEIDRGERMSVGFDDHSDRWIPAVQIEIANRKKMENQLAIEKEWNEGKIDRSKMYQKLDEIELP